MGHGEEVAHAGERRAWEHIDNEDAYYNRFPTEPPRSNRRKRLVRSLRTVPLSSR